MHTGRGGDEHDKQAGEGGTPGKESDVLGSFFPFVLTAYLMWATPGPNNMLLAYSGARFGLSKTLPHIVGVVLGTTTLVVSGLVVLEPLVERYPFLMVLLKIVGSLWLIQIGIKMIKSQGAAEVSEHEEPWSCLKAFVFQFANPKAITSAITLASLVFSSFDGGVAFLYLSVLIVPLVCVTANGPWALLGGYVSLFLSTPGRWRIYSFLMGSLTAACSLFLWV